MRRDAARVRHTTVAIDGFTAPGWSGVREAFAGAVAHFGEGGAAVCVYQAGQPVTAGTADPVTGRAYIPSTLQPFLSVSKDIVAIAVNMLADRRVIDVDAPIGPLLAGVRPEWQAGHPGSLAADSPGRVAALDQPLSIQELLSWTPVIKALVKQGPNWPPGSAHGYHSMTYAFLLGEVIRRTTGQLPGNWIGEHISGPLGAGLGGLRAWALPKPSWVKTDRCRAQAEYS